MVVKNSDIINAIFLTVVMVVSLLFTISRLIEINGGRDNNVSILEDSFEAFICALFEEAGFDICKTFVTNIIEREIDIPTLLQSNLNYKE